MNAKCQPACKILDDISTEIEKLRKNLDTLEELEFEQIFIDHIQKHLNTLDKLQKAYHNHYLKIIRALLAQISQNIDRNDPLKKRIVFFEKLLDHPPTLTELETLYKGIQSLSSLPQLLVTLKPGQIIGDLPTLPPTTPQQPSATDTNPSSILEKMDLVQQKNHEFGGQIQEIVEVLEVSIQQSGPDSLHQSLLEQAKILAGGQKYLALQLEQAKAQLASEWLQKEQLSAELEHTRALSLTDELTGLPNRRAFLNRLEEEIGRVQRYHLPISLAIIDLDHFKEINDRYGHGIGDQVLQSYAKLVSSAFRRHDLVARFGGEEFVVLLPNTQVEGAVKALNKIKETETVTDSRPTTIPGELALPTFSAGVAAYHSEESIADFIERADQALYRAKKTGRNKIVSVE